MAAVNWLWLLLAFACFPVYYGIQITPDGALQNTTRHLGNLAAPSSENDTTVGDSELSASERNRRLIPYMAFYLPAPDFPINQQYAIQRPKLSQHTLSKHQHQSLPPTATSSAGPGLTAPGHIPLPQAYVHMNLPAAETHSAVSELPYPQLQQQQQQQQQHYQPSAGEVYHTIAYGGQHPLPTSLGLKDIAAVTASAGGGKPGPVLHLLPPGPPGPAAVVPASTTGGYKHKTVQHFPPIATSTPHQQQQQQQQQQQEYPRQRPKQSKINLTPFKPSNTVPGHFIPIIYTPVSSGSSTNNNGNTINYSYEHPATAAAAAAVDAQIQQQHAISQKQQQQQQQQHNHHHSQQQIAVEYPLPPSSPPHHHHQQQHHHSQQQQQHQHQQQHQVQFIALTGGPPPATGSAAAIHSTSSPIYHVINEPSQSLSSASHQQTQQQPHQQQHQQHSLIAPQQQPQPQYRQKQPHFHPSQTDEFYEIEQPQQQLQQQQPQQQQQYLNVDNMTPQEKYVMYLQQRLRYNKQQQLQQKQQHERAKHREQYVKEQQQQQQQQEQQEQQQQQHQQIFVASTTDSPVETEVIEMQHYQRPSQEAKRQQPQQHQRHNYPPPPPQQHNPNGQNIVVYSQRPELSASAAANHQQHSKPLQQVLHIPVRAIVGEVDGLHNQQQQQQQHLQHQGGIQQQQHYSKTVSPPPQYIDYIIDEPKQSLDDELHQPQQQLPHLHHVGIKSTAAPPQAAYIVITTSAPHLAAEPPRQHEEHHNYGSTSRPVVLQYKNVAPPPTLRLQPISYESNNAHYPTRRPTISQSQSPTPRPTAGTLPPRYAYVSTKPKYSEVVLTPTSAPPTPAIKLKPSYKYELKSTIAPSDDNSIATKTTYTEEQQQQQHQQQQQLKQREHHRYQPVAPTEASKPHATDYHQQPRPTTPVTIEVDPNQLPDIRTSSLAEILHKLQASNHLPHTLTPDNIDNSIKTLITILNNLKQTQTIVSNPPQHHETPPASTDYDYGAGSEEVVPATQDLNVLTPTAAGPNKHPGPSTGRAGIDYPNYAEIPQTNFDCTEQRYKGFFGDPETNCQVWHYCDLNGGKASFLCPNGTIFSQIALTCDWWFNVKCSTTAQLYVLNERLYKYILPFTPKFPEDYSGPIVDKYLAMKFQEMEDKMQAEKQKVKAETSPEPEAEPDVESEKEAAQQNHIDETTAVANGESKPAASATATATAIHHPKEKHESINSQVGEQSSERNLLIDDEVDDISQRGSVDTYGGGGGGVSTTPSSNTASKITKQSAADEEEEEHLPLSLKPIVVSSTAEPDYEQAPEEDEEEAVRHNSVRNAKQAEDSITQAAAATAAAAAAATSRTMTTSYAAQMDPAAEQRESTKISVEKVEVIEIKSDGSSGHLMPQMMFNNAAATRR